MLVLGLELLGFVLLGFAVWLAGDTRLTCTPEAKAGSGGRLDCVIEERRLLWLLQMRQEPVPGVAEIAVDPDDETWLLARGEAGEQRTIRGSRTTTEADAYQLEALRQHGGAPISVVRSDLGWSLLTATFGFLWLIVISLIMKEFLGFHTPWWVGLFRRG